MNFWITNLNNEPLNYIIGHFNILIVKRSELIGESAASSEQSEKVETFRTRNQT